MRIRKSISTIILTLAILTCRGQAFSDLRTPQDWVMAKNYYAMFLLFQDTSMSRRILKEPGFKKILSDRHERYLNSVKCTDVSCFLNAFKWTDSEINEITSLLVKKSKSDKDLLKLLSSRLLPSNTYGITGDTAPGRYFEKALRQDFNAVNYVIDVYAGGKKPNYPKIDSISFDVSMKWYPEQLREVRQDVLTDIHEPGDAFFESLLTAVRLLELNERWDAAQLEPLMELENKMALDAIPKTNFDKYPYSLLLTLGAGPSVYGQAISPGGMLRSRMAARSYFKGLAPFIVVSGGRVHPYKTPYIEALEMKKYLMDVLKVPEKAILIDPHARHTTTNLRNTARIMLNYGFPLDKYAIVNSSVQHIKSVEKMEGRCIKEFGYVPYTLGKRISDVIIEFKPRKEALTIDPDEPLDP